MAAIEAKGLTKRYDDLVAVDDISVTVEEGELFGLLGPNGAGKSTLINMLCTLLTPTSGRATVAGHDIQRDTAAVRASIGVVFQEPAVDGELTGAENLAFHARLYGMTRQNRTRRIEEVLDLVDLQERRDDQVKTYSGGMKRRLELARGLLHRPRVLFLDEPTVGLDAGARQHTRDYIQRFVEESDVTVVLTTHYMEEADALCDRVAIADHGEIVAIDTPTALKRRLGGDVVRVGVDSERVDAVVARLDTLPWVRSLVAADGTIQVVVDAGERRVPALVTAASEVGTVRSISVETPTLEQVFLALTGEHLDESATLENGATGLAEVRQR